MVVSESTSLYKSDNLELLAALKIERAISDVSAAADRENLRHRRKKSKITTIIIINK